MKHKRLYCYEALEGDLDFHAKCAMAFFGKKQPPKLEYSLDQMSELAKNVVERSVSLPGVQPKLSMSLFDEAGHTGDFRLTVGAIISQNLQQVNIRKYQ